MMTMSAIYYMLISCTQSIFRRLAEPHRTSQLAVQPRTGNVLLAVCLVVGLLTG